MTTEVQKDLFSLLLMNFGFMKPDLYYYYQHDASNVYGIYSFTKTDSYTDY